MPPLDDTTQSNAAASDPWRVVSTTPVPAKDPWSIVSQTPIEAPPAERPSIAGELWHGAAGAGLGVVHGLEHAANFVERQAIAPAAEFVAPGSNFAKAVRQQAEADTADLTQREQATEEAYKPSVSSLGEAVQSPGNAARYLAHIAGATVPYLAGAALKVPALVFAGQGAMDSGVKEAERPGSTPLSVATGAATGAAENTLPIALMHGAAGKGLARGVLQSAAGMGAAGAASPILNKLPEAVATGDASLLTPDPNAVIEGGAQGIVSGGIFGGAGYAMHGRPAEKKPAVPPPPGTTPPDATGTAPATPPEPPLAPAGAAAVDGARAAAATVETGATAPSAPPASETIDATERAKLAPGPGAIPEPTSPAETALAAAQARDEAETPAAAPKPAAEAPAQETPPEQQAAASSPEPPGPGIETAVGAMGTDVAAALHDHLWGLAQRGEVNENGQPSTILHAAAMINPTGVLTRENFPEMANGIARLQQAGLSTKDFSDQAVAFLKEFVRQQRLKQARTDAPVAPPQPAAPPEASPAQAAPAAATAQPGERAPIPYTPIPNGTSNAFTYRGEPVPVEYGIVDARNLIPSNNDDLSPNPNYPQTLQPRDRTRHETELQIQQLLNPSRFQPEMLGPGPDAGSGTPVVGPDGVVEGGNARTLALRRAYAGNLPVADAYRRWLAEQGYPVAGIEQPMLVRINRAQMDVPQREAFARDMNIPPQAAMSPTEHAMADASQIKSDVLLAYQGGDLNSAANRPFLSGLLRAIVPENQYGAFIAPDGGLTRPGMRRVEAALIAKAYSYPSIVSSLVESSDTNIKAIGNALLDAAPSWAQMRAAVAENRIPEEFDITQHLVAAVRLIDHAREQGRNVAEFVAQQDMLTGGAIPAETEGVLQWMLGGKDFTRRFGRDKIATTLTEYAESAQRVGRLVGDAPRPQELIENARVQAHGGSGDLLDTRVEKPTGADAVRPGAGEERPGAQGQRPDQAGVEPPANGAGQRGGEDQGGVGTTALASAFRDAFAAGTAFRSINDARRFAVQHGHTLGVDSAKVLDEAIETGVTAHANDLVAQGKQAGQQPQEIFDALVNLYNRQPKLNERTADSMRRQAFSTPAPIAYVVSKLAGTEGRTVYEPTAGNGSLLIDSDPRTAIVNEIDPARRQTLEQTFQNVTGFDAATVTAPHPVDVVLANPPFGKVQDQRGNPIRWGTPDYATSEIDHAIVFKSLEAMKDDGSAVLIIGSKPEIGTDGTVRRKAFYNSAENRAFYKSLFDRYNVTDHFTVSGKLYGRQGAEWPIDVIRIEGRGKSDLTLPGVKPPRILGSFDELKEKLNDARPVGTAEQQPGDNGGRGAGTGRPELGPVSGSHAGSRGENDEGVGGRPGQGGNPGGDATGLPVSERPPGGLGAGADAGGRDGGNGADQRPAAVRVPGAGNGTEQGSGRGDEGVAGNLVDPDNPAGKGPVSRDELSNLFDDLISGKPEPADEQEPPPAAPPQDYGRAPGEEYTRPGMRQDMFWQPPEPPLAPPAPPPEPRSPPPDRGPRAPRGPRSEGPRTEPTEKPSGGLAGLGSLFEEQPFRPREYVPGVEPEKYGQALPFFVKSVNEVGAKAGEDVRQTAAKIVRALRDDHGFTPERLANMKPYLMQFIEDVQSGVVKIGADEIPLPRQNQEIETNLQVRYTPASEAHPVGTLVPINMQTAITRSLESLQARVGNIDNFVADKLGYTRDQIIGSDTRSGAFSAEQVDAIALAIDNVDRGAGFIIGDQTGVGKGRVVAAMIRYGIRQGQTPIFITKSSGLYADMYRDLRDIGMDNFNALVTNTNLLGKDRIPLGGDEYLSSLTPAQLRQAFNTVRMTGRLPDGYDALFTTYSQMQMSGGERTPRHDVLDALGPNALVVMDESHEAGGTETNRLGKDKNGNVVMSQGRAQVARDLLANAAGAVYSSATYAKNPHVMSLYFKTDMPMAVDGDVQALTALIKSGGVPLQQIVANMLIEAGQYARRERSYHGVDLKMQTLPVHPETAEHISSLLRRTFEFDERMKDAKEAFGELVAADGKVIGPDGAVGQTGITSTNFSSIMHNVIGQSLLAAKTKETVEEALAAHQRGEKPIIALSNTFGALLDKYIEEENLHHGADMSGLNFNRVFSNYLQRTREVLIKHPFDNKLDKRHFITDAELRKLGFGTLVNEYNQVKKRIEAAPLESMPASPIDYIIDKLREAGLQVGEITGRQNVIENGILTKRDASDAAKKRAMNSFNSGEFDGLVINRSGSTGFSLHASENYTDQKQRHMMLMQADPNIDTFMQILGRIHRTGQVVLPRYTLMASDMPAEKRIAAVLMRKLGSLNANTSANRESAVSLKTVTDLMNQYGDMVVGDMLNDEPGIANMLGVHPQESGGWPENIAAKVTGRMAILPIAEQERLWDRIEQNYTDLIDTLNRTGQNALEAKTVDLDARTIEIKAITEDQGVDSPFARPAHLEKVDVKKFGRPFTPEEINKRIAQGMGVEEDEVSPNQTFRHIHDITRDLDEKTVAYRSRFESELTEANQAVFDAQGKLTAAGDNPDAKKTLDALLRKAEGRAQRIFDQIDRIKKAQTKINGYLDELSPGAPIELTSGEGDSAEKFSGIVISVKPNGKTTNPTALSGWVAHIAIADGSREVKLPLSQFAAERATIARSDIDKVQADFEAGRNVRREERYMVTGNLLSGYNKFKGRGQFVMYTDADGNTRQGILFPRKFDPHAALAEQPIPLAASDVLGFIDKVYQAEGRSGVVHTADSIVSVQRNDQGRYVIEVKTRGGRQYYLPDAVNKILGSNEFSGRRGSAMRATASRDQVGRVLDWYQTQLGAKFEARTDKEHAARDAQAATMAETGKTAIASDALPLHRDLSSDFRDYAAANPGRDVQELARDWVVERGNATGFEHMAVVDAATGRVEYAGTNDDTSRVAIPPGALERAKADPNANLVLYHNHPADTALSGPDIYNLGYLGIDRIYAHAHDGDISQASLSAATRAVLSGMHPDLAEGLVFTITKRAAGVVRAHLQNLLNNERITLDQANQAYSDLLARSLESAGVIDYISSHAPKDSIPENYAKFIIREAAIAVRQRLDAGSYPARSPEQWKQVLDRSTRTVQPEEGFTRLPEKGENLGSDRPRGDRGDRGNRESAEKPSRRQEGVAAEDRPFAATPDDDDANVKAALARMSTRGEKQSLVDKARQWRDDRRGELGVRFKQYFLDSTAALEAAEKGVSGGKLAAAVLSPTIRARLARNSPQVAALAIGQRTLNGGFEGGMVHWDAKDGINKLIPGSKSLVEFLAPLADKGLEDPWALWMITNRAARLAREGREHNVLPDDIEKYKDLDQRQPDGGALFRQVRDDWRTYNKQLLDYGQATGIVNPKTRPAWEKDDYAPFYRMLDEDMVSGPSGGGRDIANIKTPIKRLKGGKDKIADLYDNMAKNTSAIIGRGMRNTAMQATVDLLSGTGALTPLSKVARLELGSPEGRARLEAMGLDPDRMTAEAKAAARDLFDVRAKDPQTVSVMVDGKAQYYRVEDPLLLRSLIAMGPRQVEGVMRILTGARNLVTRSVMLDPAFMVAHLLRMTTHTWVSTGYDVTPGLSTMRGLVSSFRSSPSSMAMIASGAVGGSRYHEAPGEMRKAMADPAFKASLLNGPKAVGRAIEAIGRASDQANRIAVYDAAIRDKLGPAEASYRAQDVLNFSMRGDGAAMNFLADTVPFLNARAQGLYRTYRGLRENPSTVLLRGGMMMAATLALWNSNKDDPRYQALPDWDKQYAWHFFVGDHHFRLPKPFEVGAIFASIPEMFADYSENGSQKQLVDAFTSNLMNQLKFDPVPGLIRPMLDISRNKNSFTGAPIVNAAEQKGSPTMQYGPHTSATAIGAGQITGALPGVLALGPDQLQFLAEAYGGAVAGYFLAAVDAMSEQAGVSRVTAEKRVDQYPVAGRFMREDPAFQTRWKNDFYNLEHEVNQLRSDFDKLKKEGTPQAVADFAKANAVKLSLQPTLNAMQTQMGKLRGMQTRIEMSPALSAAQKREQEDQLLAAQNRIAERIRPLLQRVEGLPASP